MRLPAGLAELLFPSRCAGCETPGDLLCARCTESLTLIEPSSACPRCGAPLGAGRRCRECADLSFCFEAARCAGLLRPPLSRAVTLFKDGGERRLATLLASLMADALPKEWLGWPDVVTAVPASRAAIARRGFDHASLLAATIAESIHAPHAQLLGRRGGADQRALGRQARAANTSHAFSAVRQAPEHVLLVDDVMTTGATADAAARALLGSGAGSVRVLAVARVCDERRPGR